MSINLIDAIQTNLEFPVLQKIDPNTQEVKKPDDVSPSDFIGQAAIPTVLLGLYRYSRTPEGNAAIVNGTFNTNPLDAIFGDVKEAVINKVSHYTNNAVEYTSMQMEKIAKEAVRLVQENIKGVTSDNAVTSFLSDQRTNILTCLPAELQIGELLQDNTIDDRTHKMEGPMSGAMHWIEKLFSSSDRKKEENF